MVKARGLCGRKANCESDNDSNSDNDSDIELQFQRAATRSRLIDDNKDKNILNNEQNNINIDNDSNNDSDSDIELAFQRTATRRRLIDDNKNKVIVNDAKKKNINSDSDSDTSNSDIEVKFQRAATRSRLINSNKESYIRRVSSSSSSSPTLTPPIPAISNLTVGRDVNIPIIKHDNDNAFPVQREKQEQCINHKNDVIVGDHIGVFKGIPHNTESLLWNCTSDDYNRRGRRHNNKKSLTASDRKMLRLESRLENSKRFINIDDNTKNESTSSKTRDSTNRSHTLTYGNMPTKNTTPVMTRAPIDMKHHLSCKMSNNDGYDPKHAPQGSRLQSAPIDFLLELTETNKDNAKHLNHLVSEETTCTPTSEDATILVGRDNIRKHVLENVLVDDDEPCIKKIDTKMDAYNSFLNSSSLGLFVNRLETPEKYDSESITRYIDDYVAISKQRSNKNFQPSTVALTALNKPFYDDDDSSDDDDDDNADVSYANVCGVDPARVGKSNKQSALQHPQQMKKTQDAEFLRKLYETKKAMHIQSSNSVSTPISKSALSCHDGSKDVASIKDGAFYGCNYDSPLLKKDCNLTIRALVTNSFDAISASEIVTTAIPIVTVDTMTIQDLIKSFIKINNWKSNEVTVGLKYKGKALHAQHMLSFYDLEHDDTEIDAIVYTAITTTGTNEIQSRNDRDSRVDVGKIILITIQSTKGARTALSIGVKQQLSVLFEKFSAQCGDNSASSACRKFKFDGQLIDGNKTPIHYDMEDGDQIDSI